MDGIQKYYNGVLLDDLTVKPGAILEQMDYGGDTVTWQRWQTTTSVGQGVQFITPVVVLDGVGSWNVRLADGAWLSLKEELTFLLKEGVLNMVYIDGHEIVEVYRHA